MASLGTIATPSRTVKVVLSPISSQPWSLTIRVRLPMRTFLSTIAPSMIVPSPMPIGGSPRAVLAAMSSVVS